MQPIEDAGGAEPRGSKGPPKDDFDEEPLGYDDEKTMAQFRGGPRAGWEATKAFIHALVFGSFLIGYTYIVLEQSNVAERYMQAHLKRSFTELGPDPNQVQSLEDFWYYVEQGLMVGIYGNMTGVQQLPGVALEVLPALGQDEFGHNRILGAVQFRQVKVLAENAEAANGAYAAYFTQRMPGFSDAIADTTNFGTRARMYAYDGGASSSHVGQFATYGGGGFTEYFTSNYTHAEVMLAELKAEWLDARTRAIFVDFNVWNPNYALYAAVRIVFEISPVGVWGFDMRTLTITPRYLSAFGMGSTGEWVMTILEMCIMLFLLYYLAEEISEFSVDAKAYVSDGWNLLDWANLLLLAATAYYRLGTYFAAADIEVGVKESKDVNHYTNLQLYGEQIFLARQLNSFNAMLIWIKCVKYLPMLPHADTLRQLIGTAWKFFVSFFVVFCTFFCGFGLSYTVGFGDFDTDLGSWGSSCFFLARSFLGDVDVTRVYNRDPTAGGILLAGYTLAIYMVLLNVWYALMLHAYSQTRVSQNEDADAEEAPLSIFLRASVQSAIEAIQPERTLKKRLPGLYARTVVKWQRQAKRIEKRRARRLEISGERAKMIQLDRDKSGFSLLPFSRNLARGPDTMGMTQSSWGSGRGLALQDRSPNSSPRAGEVRIQVPDDDSAESDQDLDLGPLSPAKLRQDRKRRERYGRDDETHDASMMELEKAVDAMGKQLLARIDYMGSEVKQEMRETREVMSGIKDVIQVLNRRIKDLDIMQRQNL